MAECPKCLTEFVPVRKGNKFCGGNCRKSFSRPTQNSRDSPTKRRRNAEFFDNAQLMGNRLYSLPPQQRLGYIKDLIDGARAGNTQLRELLSNYKLLHPNPVSERWLFPRLSPSYRTIAQAAQGYCWMFWGSSVADVVYCRVPEPPTGEVVIGLTPRDLAASSFDFSASEFRLWSDFLSPP